MSPGEIVIKELSAVEFIVVDGLIPNEKHHLIIRSSSSNVSGVISIRVHYLFGPLTHLCGALICDMGARIGEKNIKVTNGEVMVKSAELRGLKIGSYVFNEIINWVKQNGNEEAQVSTLKLSSVDAIDPINKIRRNQLYRKFGFDLAFDDGNKESEGKASILKISELKTFDRSEWSNIRIDSNFNGLREIQHKLYESERAVCGARRLARAHKRDINRHKSYLAKICLYMKMVIWWPSLIICSFAGYFVGREDYFNLAKEILSNAIRSIF